MLFRNVKGLFGVLGPTYKVFLTSTDAPAVTQDMRTLTELVESGALKPLVDARDFELTTAGVGDIVAIDRGEDDIGEVQGRQRLRQSARLVGIQNAARVPGLDRAKAAAAGADIAHDHDGEGARAPALADVGAARLLADRRQALVAHEAFEASVVRP